MLRPVLAVARPAFLRLKSSARIKEVITQIGCIVHDKQFILTRRPIQADIKNALESIEAEALTKTDQLAGGAKPPRRGVLEGPVINNKPV